MTSRRGEDVHGALMESGVASRRAKPIARGRSQRPEAGSTLSPPILFGSRAGYTPRFPSDWPQVGVAILASKRLSRRRFRRFASQRAVWLELPDSSHHHSGDTRMPTIQPWGRVFNLPLRPDPQHREREREARTLLENTTGTGAIFWDAKEFGPWPRVFNLWNRCQGHGQVKNLPPRAARDTDKLKTCRHEGRGTSAPTRSLRETPRAAGRAGRGRSSRSRRGTPRRHRLRGHAPRRPVGRHRRAGVAAPRARR